MREESVLIFHQECVPCCAFGNAQMVKGEDDGTRVYDRPGQQIGLDAFGPVTPPDVFGNAYTFNAIDGATEYIQCWACKIPSEWRTGFNTIVAQAETLHNTSLDELRVLQQAQAVNLDEIDPKATSFSVKPPRDALPPRMKLAILRTDCAGYFFEKEFVKDCEEKGIKLEKQTPRTHYLGGATESLNDPFARHVTSALKHGNAPMAFWTFAWYQNQLVKNLALRRGRKHSPYELWHSMVAHDVKSMVARLRVLFCLGYPTISSEIRTKLAIRAQGGIHLGAAESRGYRGYFWLLFCGCIIVAECSSWN